MVVSPGFTPRPSLSVRGSEHRLELGASSVAGVHAPAFVERRSARPPARDSADRVAGVHAPAFVEREVGRRQARRTVPGVSPGFTPRPSLSGAERIDGALRRSTSRVSPGFTPRPSLSVDRVRGLVMRTGARCRRGSRPGLR